MTFTPFQVTQGTLNRASYFSVFKVTDTIRQQFPGLFRTRTMAYRRYKRRFTRRRRTRRY